MYCQLGTTRFDGAKSFATYSADGEAVIVAHALVGRKPRLQGAGIGLKNISFSLYLHQEYCDVADEINKLRTSMTSFEVLPLLWGNGKLEGNFVIASISEVKTLMDSIGNTISATINVSLMEYPIEDLVDKKQLEAKNNAFAVGSKTPPTKSNRANPKRCEQRISELMSGIKALAGAIERDANGYTNTTNMNAHMSYLLNRIKQEATKVYNEAKDSASCANSVELLDKHAQNVSSKADVILADIQRNQTEYANLLYTPIVLSIKSHNTDLQKAVRTLDTALIASPLIKSSITGK